MQSVTLRLLCEREAAIEAFEPQQYFTVEADLQLPGTDTALQASVAAIPAAVPAS